MLAALYGDDDVALAVELSARAVELARADADTLVVAAMAMHAFALLLAGRDEDALQLARSTVVEPDAGDRPFGVVGALAVQSIVAAERGNTFVAERAAAQALHEAHRSGMR